MLNILNKSYIKAQEPKLVTKIIGNNQIYKYIIAINIIIYFIILILNGENQLWKFGSLHRTLILEENQYHRFITAYFIHNPHFLLHIIFNMIGIFMLGSFVEFLYGKVNFFYIYMFSGLASTIASYTFTHPNIEINNPETVGASGAIFGLVGATGVFLKKYKSSIKPLIGKKLINNIYFIVIFNIALGVIINQLNSKVNVDNSGHLAGLITGILISLDIKPISLGFKQNNTIYIISIIMLIILIVSFIIVTGNYINLNSDSGDSWIWQLKLLDK